MAIIIGFRLKQGFCIQNKKQQKKKKKKKKKKNNKKQALDN